MPDKTDVISPGLRLTKENGLEKLVIETAEVAAELYLQGAHLTSWRPAGQDEVLFLSRRSAYREGKAIRGGIPIIFPWFGSRISKSINGNSDSRTDGPSHGFARTSKWTLADVATTGGTVNLVLQLNPNDQSKALGFDNFQTSLELSIGDTLSLKLTTENNGAPMIVEEAFHTYLLVGDARRITLSGLKNTDYLDKTDGMKRKKEAAETLILTGETDRPYLSTKAEISIDDPLMKRRILIQKENSLTTVVWNPWIETTAALSDMETDGWQHMVCVESANAMENAVLIQPGDKHTMGTKIQVEKIQG